MSEQERHGKGKSDLGLTVIGIGKLIKVTALLAVGITALVAVNHDPPAMLRGVADTLGIEHDSRHVQHLADKISGVSHKQLTAVAFGSFLYAALFAVEGVGLLLKKRWAEYFTIVITTSFIPLEIYEIVHHVSIPKIVTLILNVIVVVYLAIRVRRERHEKKGGGGGDDRKRADVSDRERGPRSEPARLGIASR